MDTHIPIPTLEQCNAMSTSRCNLMLLRTLVASDGITAMFHMLAESTLIDILNTVEGIMQMEDKEGADYSHLTDAEKSEFLAICEAIRPERM